jgi:hypothetical protein
MEAQQSSMVQPGSRDSQSIVTVRCLVLVAMLVGTVLLGVTSVASASSSIDWYGGNDTTCWQTGQLGSTSESCDSVGAYFLPTGPHIAEGALGVNVQMTTSGDYCHYYNLGDQVGNNYEKQEGIWTGFTVPGSSPTEYGYWQEGDTHENVCQADGTTWGMELRGGGNSNCTGSHAPCGMQHYVALAAQSDRPWASSLGSPSLVVSTRDDPFTYASVSQGAWGYICPLLEDSTTGNVIEYCLEEWRIGSGFPSTNTNFDVASACASAGSHYANQVITDFASGTKFAEKRPGSEETFVFGSSRGMKTFIASISVGEMESAISAVNSHCSADNPKSSSSPANYVLIGVEQGMEGGGLSELGSSTENMELWTEYTPLPPEASTTKASEEEQTQAKLNGTVNPKGTDTHYYFQYGKTTAYGASTASTDAGSGMSGVAVAATITGLEAGTAYHFRVVATSAGGTVYGSDQEFRTEVTATPSLLVHSNGEGEVLYRGANAQLYYWLWNNEKWALYWMSGAPAMAGNPTSVLTSQGYQEIFYRDTNGRLDYWWWNGEKWTVEWLGEAGAMGGDPVALVHSNGEQEIFYRGTNGQLYFWLWNGTKWALYWMSGAPAMAGNPATVLTSQGYQEIFYRDTNGRLDYWWWNGEKWTLEWLGEAGAMGGEPVTFLHSNGEQEVYYGSPTGVLNFRMWNNVEWSLQWLGSAGAL